MDLHAEPVPEQVREFGVLGPVERINAQQELVVVSGEDGRRNVTAAGRTDSLMRSTLTLASLNSPSG